MTNKEILEKAIQKAIDGGWDTYITTEYKLNDDLLINEEYAPEVNFTHINSVIFNHDFAKALWGEFTRAPRTAGMEYANKSWSPIYAWTWHLAQMVIADNSIKYLGENI